MLSPKQTTVTGSPAARRSFVRNDGAVSRPRSGGTSPARSEHTARTHITSERQDIVSPLAADLPQFWPVHADGSDVIGVTGGRPSAANAFILAPARVLKMSDPKGRKLPISL